MVKSREYKDMAYFKYFAFQVCGLKLLVYEALS
jgi:hypothetical protein